MASSACAVVCPKLRMRRDFASARNVDVQNKLAITRDFSKTFDRFIEQRRVGNDGLLHHFTESRNQFARGQRHGRFGIDENSRWLMKRAHEVFANRQIDSGFSADRRVDLSKQRRWNLHDGDAAQVNGRGESSKIAYDSTTERNYEIVAFEAVFAEEFDGFFKDRKGFVALALGHQPLECLEARGFQTAHDLTAVKTKHSFV